MIFVEDSKEKGFSNTARNTPILRLPKEKQPLFLQHDRMLKNKRFSTHNQDDEKKETSNNKKKHESTLSQIDFKDKTMSKVQSDDNRIVSHLSQ